MSADQERAVTLHGQYAGFVTRLVAFGVDQAILAIIVAVLTFFVTYALSLFELDDRLLAGMPPSLPAVITAVTTSIVVPFVYTVGFWVLAGQTPGKRLMGVRVVLVDGRPIRFWRATVRWLGYALSAIWFLGFLWILADNRRQGFHDKLAGTLVVYSRPEDVEWGAAPRERTRLLRRRRDAGAGPSL